MSIEVGQTIQAVRWMTTEEMEQEGWDRPAVILEMVEGGKIYASQDEEGNGPGTLFGIDRNGEQIYIVPIKE